MISLADALAEARSHLDGGSPRCTPREALRELTEAVERRRAMAPEAAERLLANDLEAAYRHRDLAGGVLRDAQLLAEAVVVRDAPEVWGAAEVADHLDVTTSNLGKVAGLPKPIARLACGQVWLADDIRAFRRQWRKD